MALPVTIDDGFVRLLDACFQPDEFVAIAPAAENDEGGVVPRRGVTLTASEWKSKVAAKGGIDRVFGTKLGLFLRINPMTKGGAKNDDVTAFRQVLVEFDRDEAGKDAEKYLEAVLAGWTVIRLTAHQLEVDFIERIVARLRQSSSSAETASGQISRTE